MCLSHAQKIGSKNERKKPWFRADDDDATNARAKMAYESLLTVSQTIPISREYEQFAADVKRVALDEFHYEYKQQVVSSKNCKKSPKLPKFGRQKRSRLE